MASEEESLDHFILSKRIATRSLKITIDDSFNAQPIEKSRLTEQLSWAREKIG